MGQCYVIKEYDSFTRNVKVPAANYHAVPEAVFDQLEKFVLTSKKDSDTEASELMTISSKKGIGKIISAKNYVGLLSMNDGTVIEILPKLYTPTDKNSEDKTKQVFLEMLKFLKEIPHKTFHLSSLQIEKNHLFEIFIRMFIEEVYILVKHGLKSAYIEHRDNEYFLKGKLHFPQHLKSNFAHKERFFIEYDTFSVNRPENRLIKTTLSFLRKISSNRKNSKDIRTLLTAFEQVDGSTNVEQDFAKIISDRNMKEYEIILKWCRIFLKNKSFSTFKGDGVGYALLFPMEKVFESYVAGKLKKALAEKSYQFKVQDGSYHLFDQPQRFLLKPDIVVKNGDTSVILDTKWKLLSSEYRNYGISQADMYQMYAYQKKYAATQVFLLYPYSKGIMKLSEPITYRSSDDVAVQLFFIDLLDIESSIKQLVIQLEKFLSPS